VIGKAIEAGSIESTNTPHHIMHATSMMKVVLLMVMLLAALSTTVVSKRNPIPIQDHQIIDSPCALVHDCLTCIESTTCGWCQDEQVGTQPINTDRYGVLLNTADTTLFSMPCRHPDVMPVLKTVLMIRMHVRPAFGSSPPVMVRTSMTVTITTRLSETTNQLTALCRLARLDLWRP
jgi:hypothetical protein